MTERIKLDYDLSHKYLKAGVPQQVYLMLQIKQPKLTGNSKRLPLNVSFVLDRSGSMSGAKLDYTKKAIAFAMEHLEAKDTVSVVTFDDQVEVLIPADKAVHKDQMIQMVNGIRLGGCTNLSGGLLKGTSEVKKSLSDNQVNRVILLTDGMANMGITEPEKIIAKTKEIKSQNISVSTLGVGEGFEEDLLVDMAEAGGGNFYFVASPDTIPEIFSQELQGLLSITGQNLELAFKPKEEVKVSAILGYEPTWGPEVKLPLPDIYSGDVKTLLVELTVQPQDTGNLALAQINFNYADVTTDLAEVNYCLDISLEVTDKHGLLELEPNVKVVKEVEIFKAAQAKEEAIKLADSGRFAEASEILKGQRSKLQELYNQTNDEELLLELTELDQNDAAMEAETFSPVTRKVMKRSSYQSRRKR